MRRNIGYGLLVVASLTIIAWLIGKYLLPIMPKSVNNDILLAIAILTSILGIIANFKDVLELITSWFSPKDEKIEAITPSNIQRDLNTVERSKDFPVNTIGVLAGQIRVDSLQDRIYEVFYEKPFVRPPHLRLWHQSSTSSYEVIEQRSDGFKVKGRELYGLIMWEAKGKFME